MCYKTETLERISTKSMQINECYEIEINRLLAGKSLAKEFLSECELMIASHMTETENLLAENKEKIITEIKTSLNDIFSQLSLDFKVLQIEGRAGQLKEVHLSFLRSSCLSDYPVYQVDFYDGYGRYGNIWCSRPWACQVVFQHFYKLRSELSQRFEMQNKIKGYVLDKRIVMVAESFHQLAAFYIKAAIVELRGDESLSFEIPLEIYVGEFLDKTERVGV